MKMKHSLNAGFILNTVMCWIISANSIAKDGEIEVKLQFLEYELEDFCVTKNEAEWNFLNGSAHDLKKVLNTEEKESDFYKHELEVLQKHMGKKFASKRLQRLVDVFSHPGAPLLGKMEFKEYTDYSLKLQELIGKMEIPCDTDSEARNGTLPSSLNASKKCSPIDNKKINKMLYIERNEKKLKALWTKWYRTLKEKNIKTKYDFVQQLSILDLEAEQNGEEELTDYWLKKMETTWVNYEKVQNLWREILPLYDKLKNFIKSFVIENYGKDSQGLQNIIPVHVLGSLEAHNWIRAAEKLGAFNTSDIYKSLKNFLHHRKVEDLYKAADNQTAELKLGHLPLSFYENSRFNVSSQTCQHKMMDYCEKENFLKAMFCANETPDIGDYIQINKNVMRIKYLLLSGKEEEENGYLFREGPRESVLYEAIEGLSSLRALWPDTLDNEQLLRNHSEQQKTMLSLLITALHVIPPLPYYLASDLWRINALKEIDATAGENAETTTLTTISSTMESVRKREIKSQNTKASLSSNGNTDDDVTLDEDVTESYYYQNEPTKIYDTQNLTRDWWSYRQEYQGIGSPDGELYEDYLQDINIIWNKPYLSKFLGNILQFQILEKLTTENLTTDLFDLKTVLQKGKSEPWEDLVEKYFNITEISVSSLLTYFKPLDEFLDKGIKAKNRSHTFSFSDLDFPTQGFSQNPLINDGEGEKPAEGSDALFLSLAIIAAVGLVALIVTIGRRRYKRKQRTRDRKRRLTDY